MMAKMESCRCCSSYYCCCCRRFSWKFYLTFLFHSVCPFAMDVAFLLDSSGSIGQNNYLDMKRFINEVIDHFQISPKGKQILFQLVILKLYLNCLGPHQFGYCIVDLTSTCYDSTTKKIAHSLMGQLPPRLNPP